MKKFLRENGKFITKWLIVLVVSFVLYDIFHDMATLKRGYNAIGGEMFMLMIPFWVWLAPSFKDIFKGEEK